MPQLDTSTYSSLIFWLFLTFGFMYCFLNRFIFPRLGRILQERQEHIDIQKNQIKTLLDQMEKIDEEIKNQLIDSRLKSKKMIDKAERSFQIILDKNKENWQNIAEKKEKELSLKLQEAQNIFLGAFKKEVPYLSHLFLKKLTGSAVEYRSIEATTEKTLKNKEKINDI